MKNKEKLLAGLKDVYHAMLLTERRLQNVVSEVVSDYRNSAINLIDYLSLRSKNIESLQVQLHEHGLSSLASCESHIKCQLMKVMEWLGERPDGRCSVTSEIGFKYLQRHITELLGKPDPEQAIPVMVTFDNNFADNFPLICDLLKHGMRVARINCAHGDAEIWTRMIVNLEKARNETGLTCKLYMDIAGPKIRTQIITPKHRHGKLKVAIDEIVTLTEEGHIPKSKKYIRCTLGGIIHNLRPGHRVCFDDGLFEAAVKRVEGSIALVQITRISATKPIIKSDKGINFPDTDLKVDPITRYDRECLAFITKRADMVGFSFVSNAADMHKLQEQLKFLGHPNFPIIAKIENRRAVEHLPEIILQGLKQGPTGVMVARGDLAIEIGFERMSEIQDEILWICEAAHVPAIWATQVLETLHKQGIATRGEITDAAHAAQADCVMINKGEYTLEVLESLHDILKRSRKNNFKNRRVFRKLSIAADFIGKSEKL